MRQIPALQKAYRAQDWFLQRIKTDLFLDPLRDDPRFIALTKLPVKEYKVPPQ